MNFLSVDSIEVGSHAVCEDENGEEVIIEFCDLPKNVKEGDLIFLGGEGKWHIDEKATKKRREMMADLRKNVFESEKKI